MPHRKRAVRSSLAFECVLLPAVLLHSFICWVWEITYFTLLALYYRWVFLCLAILYHNYVGRGPAKAGTHCVSTSLRRLCSDLVKTGFNNIHMRDHDRRLQEQRIAMHIALVLRQVYTILYCVCYLAGHLWHDTHPTVTRTGIWVVDNDSSTTQTRNMKPRVYGKGPSDSGTRSKRRGSYRVRRPPTLRGLRTTVSLNRALNRLGRTLVHRAFLDSRAKHPSSVPALGKRSVNFRTLKGLFRNFHPMRARLKYDEYRYLRAQLGGQHASEALAGLGPMSGGWLIGCWRQRTILTVPG